MATLFGSQLSGQLKDELNSQQPLRPKVIPSRRIESRQPEMPDTASSELASGQFTSQATRKRMERMMRENAARPLFSGSAVRTASWPCFRLLSSRKMLSCIQALAAEVLPHVYTSSAIVQGTVVSELGSKYLLPLGTTRTDNEVK